MTGKPMEEASLKHEADHRAELALAAPSGSATRIPLRAVLGSDAQ
jgi:hypothetical protein